MMFILATWGFLVAEMMIAVSMTVVMIMVITLVMVVLVRMMKSLLQMITSVCTTTEVVVRMLAA